VKLFNLAKGENMKKLLLIAVLLVIPNAAKAETCFAEARDLKHVHPEAWPSYTHHMEGHKNEKCWFPATKSNLRYTDKGGKQSRVIINPPEPEKQSPPSTGPLSTILSYVAPAAQQDSDVTNQESYTLGTKSEKETILPAPSRKQTHTKKPRPAHLADGAVTTPKVRVDHLSPQEGRALEDDLFTNYDATYRMFDAWAKRLF
jgi:hypothetical protein